ncbi:MAG: hypothetical protein JO232_17680 [Verrucomicrobia bacterium]|nr:hypothetical protein [Verrucomicrobiota bacterium]
MLRTRAKNDTVLVQVSDTGAGMNEEARLRCLEPFSTGKDQGGTDLGLDLVFASVRRHQGVIDVQSQPGKGTTFNLLLPAAT